MAISTTNSESFGAKPFEEEEPSHTWELDRLTQYAREQHETIVQGEQTLSPAYWRLGQALHLARKRLGRGQWGKYLEKLGIHKVRAAKARAIFRTFSTPKAVSGMAVEDAYDQRQRRQRRAPQKARDRKSSDRPAENADTDALAAFFEEVSTRAEELVDAAAFAEQERRQKLFPVLRTALDRLEYLGQILGAQDEVPSASQAPADSAVRSASEDQ